LKWKSLTVLCLLDEKNRVIHQTATPEYVPELDEILTKPYNDMFNALIPMVEKATTSFEVKSNILSKPFKKDS
jgi:hypothetical protein